MPHSSGGGSSHGGSHGGSSSRSGGGRSDPRFGPTYYAGSHRYVYYVGGRPQYYFSDTQYTRKDAESNRKFLISFGRAWLAFSVLMLVMMAAFLVHLPGKVDMDYDASIVIDDGADILTYQEEAGLRESFERFRDGTGVTPSFVSVDSGTWRRYTDTLELYAYRKYVDLFTDEKHWLIVFSSLGGREDWEWEGMIGDDCGAAITTEMEAQLTKGIQENLWASSRNTVQGAISSAFEDVLGSAGRISIRGGAMGAAMALPFAIIFPLVGVFTIAAGKKIDPGKDPKVTSYRCATDKEAPEEVKCAYCGGIHVRGLHANCPNCGAPLG